jgi:hypothetical protein
MLFQLHWLLSSNVSSFLNEFESVCVCVCVCEEAAIVYFYYYRRKVKIKKLSP